MSDYPTVHSKYSVQVVGGAIVDSLEKPTKLLVGQRSAPEEFAGRWEFPGGKVEEVESVHDALVRELHEELGVAVRLGSEIAGPHDQGWELNEKAAMRVFFAEIVDGEPEALQDHAQVRWVKLDRDILELDWIDADEPIVRELLNIAL